MSILRRLYRNKTGAAAVEFALVGPLFLIALIGMFDYTWLIYGKAVLEGAVAQSARNSTLENYIDSPAALDMRVRSQVQNVFSWAELEFTRSAFDSYDQIGKPEAFTDQKPYNGKYDKGECFEDLNGNGVWDAVSTGRSGSGAADDVVLYTASMEIRRILPLWRMLNQPQEVTISASTILRNQPYAMGKTLHSVVCA